VPMYHFFGSEELSLAAHGISQLATKPYVGLNSLDLEEGTEVEVSSSSGTLRLPVRLRPDLPPGVASLSAGMAALAGTSMPAWAKIARPK